MTLTNLPTICLNIGGTGMQCTLLLDGVDVSNHVRGVDVHAHVGEVTEVQITLFANVEIMGEAGRITFRKEGEHREG